MRILLDHCVPRRFRQPLGSHEVRITYEMGWSGLENGELLSAATGQFDVFVTVDQNTRYQQNLAALPLAVVILAAPNNRFETLKPYAPFLEAVLAQITRPQLIRVDERGTIEVVA